MIKIVDPIFISETGNYIKEKIEELIKEKKNLIRNINSIREIYKGIDSELIINKYLERLEIMDKIILNYDYLQQYFINISGRYSDNIEKSLKSLNEINGDLNLNNIENKTLNIDLNEVNNL